MRFIIEDAVFDTAYAVRSWRKERLYCGFKITKALYCSRKGRYYEVIGEGTGMESAVLLTPEQAVRWLLACGFDSEIPPDLEPLVLGQME